jgi:hypothetical protein
MSCDPHKNTGAQRFYLAGEIVLSYEVVEFTLLGPRVPPLRVYASRQNELTAAANDKPLRATTAA